EDLRPGPAHHEPPQRQRRPHLRQRRAGPVVQRRLEVHDDPVERPAEPRRPQERPPAVKPHPDVAVAVRRRDHRDLVAAFAQRVDLDAGVRADAAVPGRIRADDEDPHSSSTSTTVGTNTSPGSCPSFTTSKDWACSWTWYTVC